MQNNDGARCDLRLPYGELVTLSVRIPKEKNFLVETGYLIIQSRQNKNKYNEAVYYIYLYNCIALCVYCICSYPGTSNTIS